MDTYLAIASRRDERRYSERAVPDDTVERILDAGRLAGSAGNRQPWTFFVVSSRDAVERLSKTVFAPANVLGAALVVAIAIRGRGPTAFDAGRAAQNMLLAAWNEGLVSCPNGVSDQERARELLDLGEDERAVIVLSFGYPARAREPERRSPEEWSARANRRPLAELVRRL